MLADHGIDALFHALVIAQRLSDQTFQRGIIAAAQRAAGAAPIAGLTRCPREAILLLLQIRQQIRSLRVEVAPSQALLELSLNHVHHRFHRHRPAGVFVLHRPLRGFLLVLRIGHATDDLRHPHGRAFLLAHRIQQELRRAQQLQAQADVVLTLLLDGQCGSQAADRVERLPIGTTLVQQLAVATGLIDRVQTFTLQVLDQAEGIRIQHLFQGQHAAGHHRPAHEQVARFLRSLRCQLIEQLLGGLVAAVAPLQGIQPILVHRTHADVLAHPIGPDAVLQLLQQLRIVFRAVVLSVHP